MSDERTQLCNELTTIILNECEDLVDHNHLISGLRKFERSFPLLSSISIREDLTIEADMPYSKELADTYYVIINSIKDLLHLIVGPEEAKERVSKATEKFLASHLQEILETDLYKDFPGLFRFDRKVSHLEELKGAEEIDQVTAIFEDIFNAILKSTPDTDLGRLKELLRTTKLEDAQLSLSVDMGNNVRIVANSGLTLSLIPHLCGLVNDMLANAPNITEEAAVGILHTVLSRYGELPDKLRLTNHLLKGAHAKKIPIGIPALDNALGGGIPRGHSILLDGPPGIEKDIIASRFADEGLSTGAALVIALSMETPQEFLAGLSFLSTPANVEASMEMIQIVDWYTCLHSNVDGVVRHGNVLRSSKDITSVGVAIDQAVKNLPKTPSRRGVIKIASSAIRIFGFETTYDFIQTLRATLRRNDVTALFLIEGEACEERELQILHDSFDGAIEIRRWNENGHILRDIRIQSMLGTLFDERRLRIDLADEGLWFPGSGSEECPSLIPLPLSAKDRIDRFIDGFEHIAGPIPRGQNILLQGPTTEEKERVGYQFLAQGLLSGEPLLALLSQTTYGEFQKHLESLGVDIQPHVKKGEVVIVDWHSFRTAMIDGIQDEGCVVKSPIDLTSLGIAVEMVISKLPCDTPKRALIDLLSPASRIHELPETCDLVMAMKAWFNSANFTSLFLLSKDMHDIRALSMFQPLFDGIIDICKTKVGKEVRTEIGVLSMRGTPFSTAYHNLIAQGDRMIIGDMVRKEAPATEAEEPQKTDKERMFEGKVKALAREIIAMKRNEAEVKRVLSVLDELLENLPDDIIAGFAKSKEFALYEKILDRYRVKVKGEI